MKPLLAFQYSHKLCPTQRNLLSFSDSHGIIAAKFTPDVDKVYGKHRLSRFIVIRQNIARQKHNILKNKTNTIEIYTSNMKNNC